jgi:CheY-like chemotaxis protein
MRILIAEDEKALARFVRQGLESEHYTVDAFKDGEQSLCPQPWLATMKRSLSISISQNSMALPCCAS